jgi:hypothetical protein
MFVLYSKDKAVQTENKKNPAGGMGVCQVEVSATD